MSPSESAAPKWAPKIDPDSIRRLYQTEASGMLDEELLNEVIIGLFLRCKSMLAVTAATEGNVTCPECGRLFSRTDMKYGRHRSEEVIRCPACGWEITWDRFYRSYKDRQLFARNCLPAVRAFVEGFEGTRTSREKLLAIDKLIHAFHNELRENPNRPVAVNVIGGRWPDVVRLILELAYGGDEEMGKTRQVWREKLSKCTLPKSQPFE